MQTQEKFRVSAPTRVDLAGGTLDIWPLYCLAGDAKTINLAIDLNAHVDVRIKPASRFELKLISGADSLSLSESLKPAEYHRVSPSLRFPAAVVSEYLRPKQELPPIYVSFQLSFEAPLRSGLGGSSTLGVALARAMGRIFNEYVDLGWQWALMSWIRDIEASFISVPTGTQDYLAALFGGLGCYTSRAGGIDRSTYPAGVMEALNERMLVLFSGEMHSSGLSNWDIVRAAVENKPEVMQGLKQIREISDQLDSELKGHLSWKHLGKYLSEEWQARRTAFNVHTQRLDEILEYLHSLKVYGARVCGAAQGGSLLVLTEPSRREEIRAACERHGIQVLKASARPYGVNIQDN